ncbi:hypothetical protein PSPO01_09729 [Paraphaeosphaeria sporulosa]
MKNRTQRKHDKEKKIPNHPSEKGLKQRKRDKDLSAFTLKPLPQKAQSNSGRPTRNRGRSQENRTDYTIPNKVRTMGMALRPTRYVRKGVLYCVKAGQSHSTFDLGSNYLPKARHLADMWQGVVPKTAKAIPFRSADNIATSAFAFHSHIETYGSKAKHGGVMLDSSVAAQCLLAIV